VTLEEHLAGQPVASRVETAVCGKTVKVPAPGDRILVKSATSIYRLTMRVAQVGQDEIACGEGLGKQTVQISEHGVKWWWPPYPPLEG
jgi:hypothetical protein